MIIVLKLPHYYSRTLPIQRQSLQQHIYVLYFISFRDSIKPFLRLRTFASIYPRCDQARWPVIAEIWKRAAADHCVKRTVDEGEGDGEWMAIYSENAIRAGLVSNGQATPTPTAFSAK